jgi:hypothetical protein
MTNEAEDRELEFEAEALLELPVRRVKITPAIEELLTRLRKNPYIPPVARLTEMDKAVARAEAAAKQPLDNLNQ